MGGVSFESDRVVCKKRIKLLKLAQRRQDELTKAQRRYHNLHKYSLARTITNFVRAYSSHYSGFHEKNSEKENVAAKNEKFLEELKAQFQEAYKSGDNVSKLLKTEDIRGQNCSEGNFIKLYRSLATSLSCRVGSACDVSQPRKHSPTQATLKKLNDWETQLYLAVKKFEKDEGGEVAKTCAVLFEHEIRKLRDGELQQQISELLKALKRDWKVMSRCYRIQEGFMSCAVMISDASHLEETLTKTSNLKQELSDWRTFFAAYISSQRAYIEALHNWVRQSSFPSFCEVDDRPSLLLTSSAKWSACFEDEPPENKVIGIMKSLEKEVGELEAQLKKDKKQKKDVEKLKREIQKVKKSLMMKTAKNFEEGDTDELERLKNLRDKKEDELTERMKVRDAAAHAVCNGISSVFGSLAKFSETFSKLIPEVVSDIFYV